MPQARRGASVLRLLVSLGRNFLLCTGKAFCAVEEQMVLGIGFVCGAVSSAAPQCSGIAIP